MIPTLNVNSKSDTSFTEQLNESYIQTPNQSRKLPYHKTSRQVQQLRYTLGMVITVKQVLGSFVRDTSRPPEQVY